MTPGHETTDNYVSGESALSSAASDLLPYLLDEERIVAVEAVDPVLTARRPSVLREIRRLTAADSREQIGDNGSAMAAIALDEAEVRPEFHLYETLFGRDSLRVAHNALDRYPKLTRATLLDLAKIQGRVRHQGREEQPGKIIHEYRELAHDPIAQRITEEEGWEWPYYGAVDSTLLYIRTLRDYCNVSTQGMAFLDETTGSSSSPERTVADSLVAAVGWLERKLDDNPEHIVEYQRMNPGGISNQVWKDSWDSYFHEDGQIANHDAGIASIEVQALAYDALLDAAQLYEDELGRPVEANRLVERAEALKLAINELFWVDERGGYFALGTDRDSDGRLRQLKIKTSNMGHVLNSRLLEDNDPDTAERKQAVIQQLFQPELQNCSGIRTLATDEVRFKPGAYHNGSVWLWDTYYIAQGLERHGYRRLASTLETKLKTVVKATGMFPEFVRGGFEDTPELNQRIVDIYDDHYHQMSRIEQPPQQVQAWTVSALLSIKSHARPGQHITRDPLLRRFEKSVLAQNKN